MTLMLILKREAKKRQRFIIIRQITRRWSPFFGCYVSELTMQKFGLCLYIILCTKYYIFSRFEQPVFQVLKEKKNDDGNNRNDEENPQLESSSAQGN